MSMASTIPAAPDQPGFIRTEDGVALFYRDWGLGKPVVFLSSWSLNSDSWAYQMLALAERGYRCIAYDRRGHGRSSDPGTGFDFDRLADDLATLLDTLDLNGVTLVGHSMSCGEIVRYLSRHGDRRVSRTVLVGTVTPTLSRTDDNPDGIDPAVFETFRSNCLLQDFPKWLEDNIRPFMAADSSPGMMAWVKSMALQASLKALLDCHRATTSTDFRRELQDITVPTLLIHGDLDVSSPLAITGMTTAELMANATLTVYEGAPHGLFLTHMDRFNRDLLTFLDG
ncbi:alpha/beta hydrolase [Azospirillum brasilense]|uniref:Alpha/beta hydrolase n=1 Tax=Azospirillum brasilense TaxID=192 RepID=A0A0P0FBI3_AZOBR|nr:MULTISPECIES: alpha/beta hydrolase [Azospirillum]ALJ36943.1 arylesterase [Azospirillum brasilense]MDW7551624.1 alpha/beta hydrolase [Azospirillum brasilense]MDW7591059.1 alpha/beta hydrolase [Azospirillum brasilense]MDW7626229.1 alpha/beta hydrolase [Azospirillum brasilense]MDX5951423.1 alpha/beta hydrolase [Azospirillum brasilense]